MEGIIRTSFKEKNIMKNDKEMYQVRVPKEVYIPMRLRAMKEGITVTKYAEQILRMGLKERKMNIVNK